MAVKQLSATGTLFTDRRDFYISPQVVKEKWASVAPFLTVVANQQTVTNLPDPIFKMFQHTNPWENQRFVNNGSSVTIPSDNTESDAIIVDGIVGLNSTVDDSYEGYIVEVWDSSETSFKGAALITDATTSTTIKLKSLLSTSFATVDNDVFIVMYRVSGEGVESPEGWQDELDVVWNSTGIQRVPLSITGTLLEASLRGEKDELLRLRLQKSATSKFQAEQAMLKSYAPIGTNLGGSDTFSDATGSGAKWRTDGAGKKVRTTFGAIAALREYGSTDATSINQNVFTINRGTFTQEDWIDLNEKLFDTVPNSGMKDMFCGSSMMAYWSQLTAQKKSEWEINLSDMKRDTLGFNFKILETPGGLVRLIRTPALRGPYAGTGLVISREHMKHVIYRTPEFRAAILSKMSSNAPDLVKDEYFRDEGMGMTHIGEHALITVTPNN